MIVKKFTYREVCRALGLELMKLRWNTGSNLNMPPTWPAWISKRPMPPKSGAVSVKETSNVCSGCMTPISTLS